MVVSVLAGPLQVHVESRPSTLAVEGPPPNGPCMFIASGPSAQMENVSMR